MSIQKISTNGICLNVEIYGEGPPILLLHGWPDDASVWRHQVAALVADGYQCVVPNLRGVGGSDAPGPVAAYRSGELAADVLGVLDALGLDKVQVVGHDWGASIVWTLLALNPGRFVRAVVMSVGHPACMWDMTNIEQRAASWYVYYFQLQDFDPKQFSKDDYRVFRAFMAGAPDLERRIERFNADPKQFVDHIKWYRALDGAKASKERYETLPKIKVPLMALSGGADFALTASQLQDSASYVEADYSYEVLDGAGHWLQLECPDAVNSLLLGYLRK